MDLSSLKSQLKDQRIAIISEEAVDMVQETVRLLVRAIRVRRLVLELQDQVLKVDRCHYTEDYLREVSRAETLRKSLVSIYVRS